MSNIELAYKDLQEEREYVTTQIAYIDKSKREGFINKMNFKIGLRQKILLELEQKQQELEALKLEMERMGGEQSPICCEVPEEKVKTENATIKELILMKGKEAARAESLSRAKEKWPHLY